MHFPMQATATPHPPLWRSIVVQACVLSLLAGVPAWITGHYDINWGPAPEFQSVPPAQIRNSPAAYLLVDVRNPDRFERGHAPGAVLFGDATYTQDLEKLRSVLTARQQIVVFGEGVGSERATRIARQLRKDLPSNPVHFLEGGWAAWPREQKP
jgi:rhodanese-related sulfurtransferase